jgi:hypothetical protein
MRNIPAYIMRMHTNIMWQNTHTAIVKNMGSCVYRPSAESNAVGNCASAVTHRHGSLDSVTVHLWCLLRLSRVASRADDMIFFPELVIETCWNDRPPHSSVAFQKDIRNSDPLNLTRDAVCLAFLSQDAHSRRYFRSPNFMYELYVLSPMWES